MNLLFIEENKIIPEHDLMASLIVFESAQTIRPVVRIADVKLIGDVESHQCSEGIACANHGSNKQSFYDYK